MGQLKDLVVTGATRLLGKITTKDVEINGGLIINPGSKADLNEGIRINKSNTGCTTLVLGGEPGSTSGAGSGIWSMHTYNGNFYLSHNGARNGYPMIIGDKSSGWNIYGRVYCKNGITIDPNITSIMFRDDDSWASWVSHETDGNEALVFGTHHNMTSFIFANGINKSNITNSQWITISSPGLQIKNNCVSIGELIANNVTPSYKLTVNGDVNIKGGINISGTFNGNIGSTSLILAATDESNEMSIKINTAGSTPLNVSSNASIRKALDFRWYDTHWQIGNIRGDSGNSVGFGFAYSADNGSSFSMKARIDTDGNVYATTFNGNAFNGTASKANTLNTTNGNEINFSGSSDIVWFNYRNPDTGNYSGNTNITSYIFANRNGSEKGVTLVTDDIKVLIDNESVSLKTYVSNGKGMVAGAITGMGVSTEPSATFETMAANIGSITPTLSGSWSGLTFSYNATNNGKNKVTASTKLTHDNTGSGSWSSSEPQTYSWSATSNVKNGETTLSTKTASGKVSLTVNAGGTVIPSTSEQTIISAGSRLYFSGNLKVADVGGDAHAYHVLSGYTFSSNSVGRNVSGTLRTVPDYCYTTLYSTPFRTNQVAKNPAYPNSNIDTTYTDVTGNYVSVRSVQGYHANSGRELLVLASSFGDATAGQVLSGNTFTSTAGVKVSGTMPTAKSIAAYTFNGSYFVKLNGLSRMPGSGSGGGLGTKIPKAYFDGENDYIEFATDTFGDAKPCDVIYDKTFTGLYPSAKLSGTLFYPPTSSTPACCNIMHNLSTASSIGGTMSSGTYTISGSNIRTKLANLLNVHVYSSGNTNVAGKIFTNYNGAITIITAAAYPQYYCVIRWKGKAMSSYPNLDEFTIIYNSNLKFEYASSGSAPNGYKITGIPNSGNTNLTFITLKTAYNN